jgi:hypothetical protein
LPTIVRPAYGWALFAGIPFTSGLLAALIHSVPERRSAGACCAVAALPVLITGALLIAIAVEGAICVLMALPIGLPIGVFGGMVGFVVQDNRWGHVPTGKVCACGWLVLALLLAGEGLASRQPAERAVATPIDIDAPPAVVWRHVIAFSDLAPPTEWVFHTGIAYPVRATIRGTDVGAVRQCEFSTGPFVEPITTWDEPRLLRFDVTHQPDPMRELSPYHGLHPAHLDGFFASQRGEFQLIDLGQGRTRLIGTTWYRQRFYPEAYWRQWSDWLVHTIHLRVLRHIRLEAETAKAESARGST